MIIANSGDSVLGTIDSVFVEGDFTVETGKFATPTYMYVDGIWTMNTGTALHVQDISTLDIVGDFDSQTATDLLVNGYGTVQSTITLNSDITGNGTIFAQTYEIGDFTVFGVSSPPEATFISAYNWDGDAGNNDWDDGNNWSNGKVPNNGTDVTIDPGTPEGNYPSISDNGNCKSLILNANTKFYIETGGNLQVKGSVNIYDEAEMSITDGLLSTTDKKKGTFDSDGGSLSVQNNGGVDINNYMKFVSGSVVNTDNSDFSIEGELQFRNTTATLDNCRGQVKGKIRVENGGELTLLNGSFLTTENNLVLKDGSIVTIDNSIAEVKNKASLASGSQLELQNAGDMSVSGNLEINASTVKLDNSSTARVVEDVNVGAGSELKLLNGSHFELGGVSTRRR